MLKFLKIRALVVSMIACALFPIQCFAGDLMVLATTESMLVLEDLAPAYAKLTGRRVHLYFTSADALRKPLRAAAQFDVAILPASIVGAATRANGLVLAERVDIARYGMGIAVKAGAPHAPVRNAAQLRELLLGAKSIAVAREGTCGDRFLLLLENLGVAGRADLAVQPAREIAALKSVSLLAPWPPEVQCYETLTGAVSARSKQPAAARGFLRFITSDKAAPILRGHGEEPVPAANRRD